MKDEVANSTPIQLVHGPRNASLELRGTVLVYHQRGWAGSASVYIPVEWVTINRRTRLNTFYLLGALLLLAFGVFLLSSATNYLSLLKSGTVDSTWAIFVLAAWSLASVGVSVYWLVMYSRRKPTTQIAVNSEPGNMNIEFWHTRTQSPELDRLVEQLGALRERIGEAQVIPLQTSHTWYRLRPLRAVVMKGFLFSVVLYIPVSLLAAMLERPELFFFLLAPPTFYIGQYGVECLKMLSSPKPFRQAVRAYNRGEFSSAEKLLDDCFALNSRLPEALLLSVYVSLEQQRFDRAFEQCRKFSTIDEEHADLLGKEIWAIKRMYDRMRTEA